DEDIFKTYREANAWLDACKIIYGRLDKTLLGALYTNWVGNPEDDTTLLKKADEMTIKKHKLDWERYDEHMNNARTLAYITRNHDDRLLERMESYTYQVNRIKYFMANSS